MKVKIALTPRILREDGYEHQYFNQDYITRLEQFNCEVIPILFNGNAQELAKTCDGLLLTGGADLDPKYYEQENIACKNPDIRADESDFRLIQAFVDENKPILGICRGIQSINVYFKGSLIQDLPLAGYEEHMIRKKGEAVHQVEIKPHTQLASIFGETLAVNSLHHQAVDRLADGFIISAMSQDGVIEAIEKDHILAVQWHPECLDAHKPLFEYFIQQCKNHSK